MKVFTCVVHLLLQFLISQNKHQIQTSPSKKTKLKCWTILKIHSKQNLAWVFPLKSCAQVQTKLAKETKENYKRSLSGFRTQIVMYLTTFGHFLKRNSNFVLDNFAKSQNVANGCRRNLRWITLWRFDRRQKCKSLSIDCVLRENNGKNAKMQESSRRTR